MECLSIAHFEPDRHGMQATLKRGRDRGVSAPDQSALTASIKPDRLQRSYSFSRDDVSFGSMALLTMRHSPSRRRSERSSGCLPACGCRVPHSLWLSSSSGRSFEPKLGSLRQCVRTLKLIRGVLWHVPSAGRQPIKQGMLSAPANALWIHRDQGSGQ